MGLECPWSWHLIGFIHTFNRVQGMLSTWDLPLQVILILPIIHTWIFLLLGILFGGGGLLRGNNGIAFVLLDLGSKRDPYEL